ncbi:hypothetical protein XELAEV_18040510mg [Xenopus laevis]|uniref:Uncharacterized protein n=1 Tax=Xenopus laevis TaxID=8355 RepID=A0A974H949_XENLA|nr:hypothetical protein XELAEV_18040510mg [Xenopus laevis]
MAGQRAAIFLLVPSYPLCQIRHLVCTDSNSLKIGFCPRIFQYLVHMPPKQNATFLARQLEPRKQLDYDRYDRSCMNG